MTSCMDTLETELEDLLFELQVEVIQPSNIKYIDASISILETKIPTIQILIDNIKVELQRINKGE